MTASLWSSAVAVESDTRYLNENLMAFVALEDKTPPGTPIMMDVGAHFGGSLMKFLQADWDVWAFEPDPSNRSKLFERLANQEHMPRRVDKRAVSEVSGEQVDFYVSPVSAGISTLRPFHDTHQAKHTVTTVRLDDFIAGNGIQAVDYLKIDIEGFDFFALKSFPFDTIRPKAILCEFEDRKTVPLGYTHRDLGLWLNELGYQVLISEWHPIVEYGQAHSWRSISEYQGESLADDAWGNFLCFDEPLSAADLERFSEAAMRSRPPKSSAPTAPAAPESTTSDATATPQLDEIVNLLHDVVTTLARHERSITSLETEHRPDVITNDARMNL